MIYVVGDVHGDLRSFKKLLSKIRFNAQQDKMYLLGDVLDRGNMPLELLSYINKFVELGCMFLIKGNHEYFCELYLAEKLGCQKWDLFGGEKTRSQVDQLSLEEKKELLCFLKALPYYMLIDSPRYGNVVLTHSGINLDYCIRESDTIINVTASIEEAMKKDEYNTLISIDIHNATASDLRKLDKYIICGHMHTFNLRQDGKCLAYVTKCYMDIDCGCGYENGKLCCYVVEEDKFIYVNT